MCLCIILLSVFRLRNGFHPWILNSELLCHYFICRDDSVCKYHYVHKLRISVCISFVSYAMFSFAYYHTHVYVCIRAKCRSGYFCISLLISFVFLSHPLRAANVQIELGSICWDGVAISSWSFRPRSAADVLYVYLHKGSSDILTLRVRNLWNKMAEGRYRCTRNEYDDSALLVLNGASLKINNALLILSRRYDVLIYFNGHATAKVTLCQ